MDECVNQRDNQLILVNTQPTIKDLKFIIKSGKNWREVSFKNNNSVRAPLAEKNNKWNDQY